MPTDSANPLRASRLSIFAAFAGFSLFLILVTFLHHSAAPAPVDVSQVAEADRWKFTAEGRASHLAQLHAREMKLATSYTWVDQSKGVVRIPLSQAIELVLKEEAARNP